jgi:hypothetical protein
MSPRVLVVLLVCGVASVAFAQSGGQPEDAEAHANEPSSSDARDAEVFGESSSGIPAGDARDAEVFGDDAADISHGDARDAEVFGDDARDREIFGHPAASGSGRQAAGERETDIFADQPTATGGSALESMFERGLAEQQDWLALGGLLYMRLDYYAEEETPAKQSRLASPSLMDVYLDARPNDRVRGFLRGRLRHDFTVPLETPSSFGAVPAEEDASLLPTGERTEVLLDQLWIKFDIARVAYLTIGKQAIRWGSGRFWNPTDFLNRQKRDPLAIFDERTGQSLIKLHLPLESLGWNLYAVANLDEADRLESAGGALRAEFLFAETEVALTYAGRKNNPHQFGFDISSGLWLFDVRAELAAQKGVRTPFYRGPLDLDRLDWQFLNGEPHEISRKDQWILQGTAAAELTIRYSDQDTVTLGVEYFYNDAGYKNAHLYPWLALNNQFVRLYLGRHYAAAYAYLPQPGLWNDTSFTLSGLANLSDGSYLARLDYQVRVLTYLDVNVYGTYHFGDNGELHWGFTVPAQPLVEDGFTVNQPIAEVGFALRVAL